MIERIINEFELEFKDRVIAVELRETSDWNNRYTIHERVCSKESYDDKQPVEVISAVYPHFSNPVRSYSELKTYLTNKWCGLYESYP